MNGGEIMDNRKALLLASAARLYSLGIDLDSARDRLRKLVEQSVSFDSEGIRQAYQDFKELEQQWEGLEKQYLELREEIMQK